MIKTIKENNALKKTFPALKQRYGKRYYFEDEMRSGTRSQSKRRWTPKSHRPVCRVKLGYRFTYLYCALAPATGKLMALLRPDMSKPCFERFMDYFKQQPQLLHGNHPVAIITDKAGAHQKHLCEQRGMAMEQLPRGCPELNPVECFFEKLRKDLANHIFHSLRQEEALLANLLKKCGQYPQSIIQLCYFLYMQTT